MTHVLLGNDDGVFAPGLRALADAFLQAGFRVTVSAPEGQRSAASHSITIKRPMVAKRVQYDGVPEGAPLTVWAVDATPADCIKLALHELSRGRPDVVVSGINDGWNIGTDVHYSGTVGAAMEGAFEGVQSIAVSVERPDAARYAHAAQAAVNAARRLAESPLPLPSIINLNLPNCAPEAMRGWVEAPLTPIRYTDAYEHLAHERGGDAYWLKGEIIEEGCLPGGDLSRLLEGYATLTVLGWDLTMQGKGAQFLQDNG